MLKLKQAFADFVDEIASNLAADPAGCSSLWVEICGYANKEGLYPPLQRSIPRAIALGIEIPPKWSAILSAYAEELRQDSDL